MQSAQDNLNVAQNIPRNTNCSLINRKSSQRNPKVAPVIQRVAEKSKEQPKKSEKQLSDPEHSPSFVALNNSSVAAAKNPSAIDGHKKMCNQLHLLSLSLSLFLSFFLSNLPPLLNQMGDEDTKRLFPISRKIFEWEKSNNKVQH